MRRNNAKNALRKYVDEASVPELARSAATRCAALQRQLRDHYTARAEELQRSVSEAMAAAQRALEGRTRRPTPPGSATSRPRSSASTHAPQAGLRGPRARHGPAVVSDVSGSAAPSLAAPRPGCGASSTTRSPSMPGAPPPTISTRSERGSTSRSESRSRAGSRRASRRLLNALVGEPLAPTDEGECTRVVTWYHDGVTYRVTIHARGRRSPTGEVRAPRRLRRRRPRRVRRPRTSSGSTSSGRRRHCAR